MLGAAGQHDVVVWAVDRAGGLHEQDRLLGDRGAGFGGVLGVIEADAHEFADAGDARADADARFDERQLFGIDGAEFRQRGVREGSAGNVVDHADEAANLAGSVDEAGFFLTGRTEAKQFHGGEFLLWVHRIAVGGAGTRGQDLQRPRPKAMHSTDEILR